MFNHTLSDFIARLNVARQKHLKTIRIRPTNVAFPLLKIFEEIGIIRGYSILDTNEIEVLMKYQSSKCAFQRLIVISKPSRRIHVDMLKLYKLKELNSDSLLILSTSKGYKLDVDCLKENRGGVVLVRIIL